LSSNPFDPAKNVALSREEEADLFNQFYASTSEHEKDIIRDKIIMSNTGFVLKTAMYYSQSSPTYYHDFVSAGFEGLLIAFDKFDLSKGYRFLSYSGFWIRERVLRAMASFRTVSVPAVNQQVQAKVNKLRSRGVSEREISTHFKPEQETLVKRMMQYPYLTYSMDDLEHELQSMDVDLESPDHEMVQGLLEELPDDLKLATENFMNGEPHDAEKLQIALELLRGQMGVTLPLETCGGS
jgi:RNA polymerase sigma factor (sigma-70 family)